MRKTGRGKKKIKRREREREKEKGRDGKIVFAELESEDVANKEKQMKQRESNLELLSACLLANTFSPSSLAAAAR